MGNLVTDAMRTYFDADFSFQNLGGLRADMPAGDITARDVFAVLPFGNELVVVQMDGRMLRRIIERKVAGRSGGICISGVRMSFDTARPDYDRVVLLEIGGEPWDPDRIYKVVCTNFLMEGNSGLDFLTAIPPRRSRPPRSPRPRPWSATSSCTARCGCGSTTAGSRPRVRPRRPTWPCRICRNRHNSCAISAIPTPIGVYAHSSSSPPLPDRSMGQRRAFRPAAPPTGRSRTGAAGAQPGWRTA